MLRDNWLLGPVVTTAPIVSVMPWLSSQCVSCFGAVVGSLLLVATMPSQPTVHQSEPLTHDATFLATPPPPCTLSATEKSVGVPLVCGTFLATPPPPYTLSATEKSVGVPLVCGTFLATPPPPYTLSATEKSVGVPLVCGTFLATPPPPYTLSATEKSVGVPLVCGTTGLQSTNYTRTYYVFLWATPLRWIPL